MVIETRIVGGKKFIEVKINADSAIIDLGWLDKKQAEDLREVLKEAVEHLDYFIFESHFGSVIEQQRHGAGVTPATRSPV